MASIFKITKFFMVVTGLWKLSFNNNPKLSKAYKVYSIFLLSIFGTFSLSLIIGFFELIKNDAKYDTLFRSLTVAIIILTIFFKNLIYLKNRIPYLFGEVVDQEKIYLKSDDPDIVKTYLSQAAYYKWTVIAQIMTYFCTLAFFLGSYTYKKITHSSKEGEVFMYEIWVPFDENNHDPLISAINVSMAMMSTFCNVTVAAVFQSLMIYVSVQLRILQIRIRKLFPSHETDDATDALKVKELIRKHQQIIEFATKLNDGIKNVILIEYVLASINVAGTLLTMITNTHLRFVLNFCDIIITIQRAIQLIIMTESGFSKAQSNNLPRLEQFMVARFFANKELFSSPEIGGVKLDRASRDSYGGSAIGYVQVKREGSICSVKGEICLEHRVFIIKRLVTNFYNCRVYYRDENEFQKSNIKSYTYYTDVYRWLFGDREANIMR